MKIASVYSNRDDVFVPIRFNSGFNVIYARVTRPKAHDKDSHNLGKTLLIHLIEFLLLKALRSGHFLHDQREIFEDFEFFIELELNGGGFLTIKRPVQKNTKISLKRHVERHSNFSALPANSWDHYEIPLKHAKPIVNDALGLTAITPWDYRQGVSYFLRTQADYADVFQISKFATGKHQEWKPYLAQLLGFDAGALEEKYRLDDEIKIKEQFRDQVQQETRGDTREWDAIKGKLDLKRVDADELRSQVDRFNFYKHDLAVSAELVEQIEAAVAAHNERLYVVDYELQKIQEARQAPAQFDIERVKELFSQVEVYFPERLAKDYESLLDFNRRLSSDRNNRLASRETVLRKERTAIVGELENLNRRREEALQVLQDRETFRKFKTVQLRLVQLETEIARLEAQLERMSELAGVDRKIQELKQARDGIVNRLTDAITQGSDRYTQIRRSFNSIIREVLGLHALISVRLNDQNNFDFAANIMKEDDALVASSEGRGTSYKKLLCAAFDMAVLEAYSGLSFYRFVYHDGVLEGLDNRKKLQLLKVVNDFCNNHGLQYILTVIDADLPRDADDRKVEFGSDVRVLTLHDGGDEGRLFKMRKF